MNDLDFITVGDVFDILTELANDHEEWAIKSTQEDITAFFG